MKERSVRLTGIHISNFKNIVSGDLSFENTRKNYKASILGLYGQNGSGKTALIDAIDLLRHALCGQPVPNCFVDYINLDAQVATITYEFEVELPQGVQTVIYQLSIKSASDVVNQNNKGASEEQKRVFVFNELIKCPIITENKPRLGRLIDTENADVFGPESKRVLLVGNDRDIKTDLLVAKKLTGASSRSFIFSRELLTVMRERIAKLNDQEAVPGDLAYYYDLIEALVNYGNHCLFVIKTDNLGLISLKAQPISFKYKEEKMGAIGQLMLPLNVPAVIPETDKTVVKKIISNMNIVLQQIIPGLTIKVKDLGTEIMQNGEVGNRIQLMSCRNDREIALTYESEGIKKIVSILQLFIVVYNQSSITVAIDELDSGVFEYLLGEMLRILSEKGKGQLIFTSHNLRPLETLDRGFIAFTTTNPNHRYIRLTNVKGNNNLRDFYYRDIMLGEQKEELYETTNNSEIAFAFREAGEGSGA